MLSAGQVPTPSGQTGPYTPVLQAPQPRGQVIPMSPVGGTIFNLTGKVDDQTIKDQLKNQSNLQWGGLAANSIQGMFDSAAQMYFLSKQGEVVGSYYDYMGKVADNGMTVALRQAAVQEKGMEYSKIMMEEKLSNDRKLADINRNLQIRLAKIGEQGKTDRAGIYAANNAFRANYFNGSPFSLS